MSKLQALSAAGAIHCRSHGHMHLAGAYTRITPSAGSACSTVCPWHPAGEQGFVVKEVSISLSLLLAEQVLSSLCMFNASQSYTHAS